LCHSFIADDKFFALLEEEEARVAAGVKAAGCPFCGGRLDRADYPRKPRGGVLAAALEGQDRRTSFCCCKEGCRRRATPPSVLFLGRRVYLAIVLVVETIGALLKKDAPAPSAPPRASAPPRRTVKRWHKWFQTTLPKTKVFEAARGWLWPPVLPMEELPQALLERFLGGRSVSEALFVVLRFLSPLSTATAVAQAPFVGGA